MSLEIYQSAYTAQELESAIAGGRAPSAEGLTEFPLTAYTVSGADLQSLGDTIAEKAGTASPVWPLGFRTGAEGFEKLYFTPYGVGYIPDMVLDCTTLEASFKGADHLKSLELPLWNPTSSMDTWGGRSGMFQSAGLERLLLPRLQYGSHYWAREATALQVCQLGSIGYPVDSLGLYFFYNCLQSELEITVYVNAETLADAVIAGTAPWGAANATIIYRNSTTGEVITE